MVLFNKGYALIIGIANYLHVPKLPNVVLNDANYLNILLTNPTQCGYSPEQVRLLLDDQATAMGIRDSLQWLASQAGEDTTCVVFFSGHGGRIESESQASNYLIPVDTDPVDLKNTAIESAELTHLLGNIKAKRLLVLFDCCHAGGIGEVKEALGQTIPGFKSGLDEQYYDQLATGQGRVIIASSRSTEVSWILPGQPNSLFTHYFLEALRGKARTYDDGLIRVLDAFNFVAEAVPQDHPQQHPILKAQVENNFPIALNMGGKSDSASSPPDLLIENPLEIPLPTGAEPVLKTIFAEYQRVVIAAEFGGGFSGGRVLLIHPVRNNRRELPAVIKLASISLVQKEWQTYQTLIRNRLPNSVGVIDQPALPPHSDWGGLRYPLVGSGVFDIESLRSYCRRDNLDDICFALGRLLKIIEPMMQSYYVSPLFNLHASYDHILPVNLLVEPQSLPAGSQPYLLSPDTLPASPLKPGDSVRLEGFIVTKVDLLQHTIDLNLPRLSKGTPLSYCLRLQAIGALASYQVNQLIEPIEGVVITTRQKRLQAETQRALGPSFDLTRERLTLPNGVELLNPLPALPAIFSRYPDVKVGCTHGDLNLENILVDLTTRDVSLIDFAAAREDHLLHDFLRLETEIVTKLVPEILAKANLSAGVVYAFYRQLHDVLLDSRQFAASHLPPPTLEKPFAILLILRKAARKYLLNPDDWTEYYQGLTVYLLGALKFGNLDRIPEAPSPLPKQTAFWGAATAAGLMEASPSAQASDEMTPGSNRLAPNQRIRLERELQSLQGQWDLLSEKGKRLRAALAIETNPAIQFQLEQQLTAVESDLANLESKLAQLEQKLA